MRLKTREAKSEVNNLFDVYRGISIEAQRNESFQSVSQGREGDLMSQKESGGGQSALVGIHVLATIYV